MQRRNAWEGVSMMVKLRARSNFPICGLFCRSQLHVSVEDLKHLFWDDPEMMWVGRKGNMVLELVKMLYFDYTLETEVSCVDTVTCCFLCVLGQWCAQSGAPQQSHQETIFFFIASHFFESPRLALGPLGRFKGQFHRGYHIRKRSPSFYEASVRIASVVSRINFTFPCRIPV